MTEWLGEKSLRLRIATPLTGDIWVELYPMINDGNTSACFDNEPPPGLQPCFATPLKGVLVSLLQLFHLRAKEEGFWHEPDLVGLHLHVALIGLLGVTLCHCRANNAEVERLVRQNLNWRV